MHIIRDVIYYDINVYNEFPPPPGRRGRSTNLEYICNIHYVIFISMRIRLYGIVTKTQEQLSQ